MSNREDSSQKLSLSGANFYNGYKPQITSYDYDAPISESGELTKKYFAMREVILKHRGLQPLPVPVSTPKQRYGNIYMTKVSIYLNLYFRWDKTDCVV